MEVTMEGVVPAAATTPSAFARARLRAWHWLLTPGWVHHTPAAKLRGWARVLDWQQAGRWHLLRQAARWPWTAWQRAGEAVERHGREVERESGVSPAAQRRQLWWLAVRHGLNERSYRAFQLYRPERRARAAEYVQTAEFYRVVNWYNWRWNPDPEAVMMRDKRAFAEWCAARDLPHIPTLIEYDHGARVWPAEPVALPPVDLFQKPTDGTGGHGAERWRYVGDGLWEARDGRRVTEAALLEELAECSRTLPTAFGHTSRRMLLQPCVVNHRELLPLTPGALCTLRVVTVREPGGPALAVCAAHKLARAGEAGDNTDQGGISTPMDLATGTLGPGVGPQGAVRVTFDAHPDTGATIAGRVVPYWREAVALACRALDATTRLPSVGWDIAITDDGPVLVEGNTVSNPGIAQAPTGVPLCETPLPAAIEAHVRMAMGA